MKTYIKPIILALILISIAGYTAWRQFTPSGYVFRPYESIYLREGNMPPVNEQQKEAITSQLTQFQNSLGAFTEPKDFKKKIHTLTLISEYQQMLGKYADAKKTLEIAIDLEVSSQLLQSYSQLLFTMGAREGAVPYIDAAILFSPDSSELWRLKIDMLSEINKTNPELMDSVYRDAIKSTDNSTDIIVMYAAYLVRQGKKEEAIQYWAKAQEISPKQKAVYQQEIDALK